MLRRAARFVSGFFAFFTLCCPSLYASFAPTCASLAPMNMHPVRDLVGPPIGANLRPFKTRAPKKRRYSPRDELLDEVLAGFLWMSLNLPDDASLAELNAFAHELVSLIKANAGLAILEHSIFCLQRDHFGRPGDLAAIRALARRCIRSVNGWQAPA